jgi:hypothetical protein
MRIRVIPLNSDVSARDNVILRYYLCHSVTECTKRFDVSKSDVDRAVRNPSALASLDLTCDQASDLHDRNCRPLLVRIFIWWCCCE